MSLRIPTNSGGKAIPLASLLAAAVMGNAAFAQDLNYLRQEPLGGNRPIGDVPCPVGETLRAPGADLHGVIQEPLESQWYFSLAFAAGYEAILNTPFVGTNVIDTEIGSFQPSGSSGRFNYQDIFTRGLSFTAQPELMLHRASWEVGGYASIGVDVLFGNGHLPVEKFEADIGTQYASAKTGDQVCVTALLGPMIRYHVSSFFSCEARLGLGIVQYQSETLTITAPPGFFGAPAGATVQAGLFNSGTKFAAEGGVKGLFQISTFSIDLGLVYRLKGAPDAAAPAFPGGQQPTPPELRTLGIELGITIPF